tara:strand:+ start:659 stop:937 length:279 start_codon:yes stop_codon:yes gene_type:complete
MDSLKDHILLGIFIGVVVPLVSYALLQTILETILSENPLRESTMQLIALFVNFPLFRNLLTKYKKDSLGRGMLLSTFVLAIWYIIHHNMIQF